MAGMLKLVLLVLVIMITITPITPICDSSRPAGLPWRNNWHQSFYVYCRSAGSSLSQWVSYFRLCQEDRLHLFQCHPRSLSSSDIQDQTCAWSPVLNKVHQYFFYECPQNGTIRGVLSLFDAATNDRGIRISCCHIKGDTKRNCQTTPYKNLFGQPVLNYKVPPGYALTGVGSYHSVCSTASFSDRRWRFQICKVQKK